MGAILRGRWRLWQLRRPARPRRLFDELSMAPPTDQALQRAIQTLGQSDPLIKLLQQVRLGRMKPTDAGLRAVTESWLGTYQQVLRSPGLTKQGLRRLDPEPRVAVLIESGVLTREHDAVSRLRATFDQALADAPADL